MCVASGVAAGISAVTAVLSAAGTVYSQSQASKQSKELARYNSDVSQRDAELAEIKAADVLAQGQKDQEKARREYRARVGRMAAEFGASNVAMDSGSALALLADTTQVGELDALDIGAKAERQSQDYLRAAADAKNQAGLSIQQGNNSATNSMISAGNSIMGGINSAGQSAQGMFATAKVPSQKSSQNSTGTFGSTSATTSSTPNYNRKRGPSYF